MIRLLSAVLMLVVLSVTVSAGVPEFKKNAAEFMEVGFNKGRTGTRVTELAVTVSVKEMFEGGEDVDIEDINLEIKARDGCWTKVAESPVRRGKEKQMWRVKIVPCKEHLVRVGIKRDGCVDYFQYPEAVGPASAEEIANSHFRPKMPENIVIIPIAGDSVTVSWSLSDCAESYDLWYESDSVLDLGNMTAPAGLGYVTVMGLENCTEYTMKIVALTGEEFSEEGEADFTTCVSNTTDIPDTMTTEETNDSSCELIDQQCQLSTPQLEDFTSSGMRMVQEEDIEVTAANETQFEAQTSRASSSLLL